MAQVLAHDSNMENLREEVQRIYSGTSDQFVPKPSRKSVQADILIAIRRFKTMVRWKEFWRDQKQSTRTELNELNKETEESRFMATCLNTGLKTTFGIKTVMHGSENI